PALPRKTLFPGGLYLILDPAVAAGRPLEGIARQALQQGIRTFQLRTKASETGVFYDLASTLAPVIQAAGGLFIVNDRCDVALAVGADGVHLGQEDLPVAEARALLGPRMLIGISTHNLVQALEAEALGADYLGFGPIFATPTKSHPEPVVGIERLREVRARIRLPIVAIGGINAANIRMVADAGSDASAVLSAVLAAPDPTRAIAELMRALQG
ncbi:MAG: thiamine phosphate synthase, partial [Nitrospirota bacterium]